MTTSALHSSTSALPSAALTPTKPSTGRRSRAASRSTATSSSELTASGGSFGISRDGKAKIERHRWLIQQVETGLFLGFVRGGELLWVEHPIEALQHCQMEVACNNLWKLREYYKVQEQLRLEPVMFYAYPSAPTQWFTDYD